MSKWLLIFLIWALLGSILLLPYFVNDSPCPFQTERNCRPVTNFVDVPPLPVLFFPTYAVLHIAAGEFVFDLAPGVHWYRNLNLFLPILWVLYGFFTYAIYHLVRSWNRSTWADLIIRAVAYGLIVGLSFIILKILVLQGLLL